MTKSIESQRELQYIYVQSKRKNLFAKRKTLFAIATLNELVTLMPAITTPDIQTQVLQPGETLTLAWRNHPLELAKNAAKISKHHKGEEGFLPPKIKIVSGPATWIK